MIGTPALPRTAATGTSDVGERLEGTKWIFYLLLFLLVYEFLGLDRHLPILKTARFSTLLGFGLFFAILARVGARAIGCSRQGRLLALFVVFSAVTIPLAVVQTYAFDAFKTHFGYFGLFLVAWYVVDRPERIRQFAIVASIIIVIMIARNFERLIVADRGAAGGFDAGDFVSNGNDFAWGLNVLLPFPILLFITRQGFVWRIFGLAAVLAGVFGVIGTQSRGATIALALGALFYWAFVMKRKAVGVAVLAVGIGGILVMAPPAYFDRMKSIQNIQEDNSAMTRFQLWRAATFMAMDYPLGVGGDNFAAAYGRYYVPDEEHSLRTWAQGKWMSAHSVYFRLLGEYGIFGPVWVIVLLVTNWRHNWASYHRLRHHPRSDSAPPEWPLLINMSLVGYAVSGLFLGGAAYPHLHLLSGLTAAAFRQGLWHSQSIDATASGTSLAMAATRTHFPTVAERAQQMMHSRRKVS